MKPISHVFPLFSSKLSPQAIPLSEKKELQYSNALTTPPLTFAGQTDMLLPPFSHHITQISFLRTF